jgi:hypothetical protein
VTYGTKVVIVGLLVCVLVTVRGPEVVVGAVATGVVEIAAVPGTVKTVSVLVSQSEVFEFRCDGAALLVMGVLTKTVMVAGVPDFFDEGITVSIGIVLLLQFRVTVMVEGPLLGAGDPVVGCTLVEGLAVGEPGPLVGEPNACDRMAGTLPVIELEARELEQ